MTRWRIARYFLALAVMLDSANSDRHPSLEVVYYSPHMRAPHMRASPMYRKQLRTLLLLLLLCSVGLSCSNTPMGYVALLDDDDAVDDDDSAGDDDDSAGDDDDSVGDDDDVKTPDDDDSTPLPVDADGDGDDESVDCDDSDPLLNNDDIDNDGFSTCDGDCEDSNPGLNLDDLDGDGFSTCIGDCDDLDADQDPADLDSDGVSTCAGDCDDDPATGSNNFPGNPESCDGVDNDCDTAVDNDVVFQNWYLDNDDDGFGDVNASATYDCQAPSGASYVTNNTDCDDSSTGFGINPSATEVCDGIDNNCAGGVDEGFADFDGDTSADCVDLDDDDDGDPDTTDCDDNNAAVSTLATEVCDGIDNDCASGIDDGFADFDGDNSADCVDLDDDDDGDPDTSDCADFDASISTLVTETCDGIDNNCVGGVDEGFPNFDGDTRADCVDLDDDDDGDPDTTDCDDNNTAVSTLATEVCDGIDNDCVGGVDEGFANFDGDSIADCVDPDDDNDFDPDTTDCNDADASIFTGAFEACDGIDSDCDGVIPVTELDVDGDGEAPCQGDCDDTPTPGNGPLISSQFAEVGCDGLNNDCSIPTPDVLDADGDGYSCAVDCDDTPGTGAAVFPNNPEVCDGIDNNCIEGVDEGLLGTLSNCPAVSCLAILTESGGTAPDGTYFIDPDGVGIGQGTIGLVCDMTGGGWTVLYTEDFSSGGSSGWLNGTSPIDVDDSNCASAWTNILGGFNELGASDEAVQTFSTLGVPHTEVRAELDYVVIDSWDEEDAIVQIDGTQVWRKEFHHRDVSTTSCGLNWKDHGPQEVDETQAHTATSVTVRATSTLSQDAWDESFGLDNVRITIR